MQTQTAPAPPTTPAPTPTPEVVVVAPAATASAQAAYEGARAARNEIRQQVDALVSERHRILRELEDHNVAGPATAGMQARIVALDGRIAALDVEIAKADAAVATAAAVPGAVERPSEPSMSWKNGPPEELFIVIPSLFFAAMLPIIIAYSRRIWRRGAVSAPQLPSDLSDRLSRLEQMGETTALEVERIGEGQRFVTRLLTERADPAIAERVGIEARR